jgi:hypothetical protein
MEGGTCLRVVRANLGGEPCSDFPVDHAARVLFSRVTESQRAKFITLQACISDHEFLKVNLSET